MEDIKSKDAKSEEIKSEDVKSEDVKSKEIRLEKSFNKYMEDYILNKYSNGICNILSKMPKLNKFVKKYVKNENDYEINKYAQCNIKKLIELHKTQILKDNMECKLFVKLSLILNDNINDKYKVDYSIIIQLINAKITNSEISLLTNIKTSPIWKFDNIFITYELSIIVIDILINRLILYNRYDILDRIEIYEILFNYTFLRNIYYPLTVENIEYLLKHEYYHKLIVFHKTTTVHLYNTQQNCSFNLFKEIVKLYSYNELNNEYTNHLESSYKVHNCKSAYIENILYITDKSIYELNDIKYNVLISRGKIIKMTEIKKQDK